MLLTNAYIHTCKETAKKKKKKKKKQNFLNKKKTPFKNKNKYKALTTRAYLVINVFPAELIIVQWSEIFINNRSLSLFFRPTAYLSWGLSKSDKFILSGSEMKEMVDLVNNGSCPCPLAVWMGFDLHLVDGNVSVRTRQLTSCKQMLAYCQNWRAKMNIFYECRNILVYTLKEKNYWRSVFKKVWVSVTEPSILIY